MEIRGFISDHAHTIFIISVASLLIISSLILYANILGNTPGNLKEEEGQVAILDQFPNQGSNFTQKTTELFKEEGIQVDVYKNISVNLYRELPDLNYKVIIFRVHSATSTMEGGDFISPIFTTEEYRSSKYPTLQSKNYLVPAAPQSSGRDQGEIDRVFAVTPKFITSEMKGKFNNTLVIFNSCHTITPKNNYRLLKTFYGKGVGAFIGWRGSISLRQGDQGTLEILKQILKGKTLSRATSMMEKNLSSNPNYKARIMVPKKSANQKLKIKEGKIVLEE